MQRSKQRRRTRTGFTLMELMIVMGILVLLAAMVLPRVMGSRDKADIQSTEIQIGSFRKALDSYKLDMRKFPSSEDGLNALLLAPTAEGDSMSTTTTSSTTRWDGPYLETDELPLDPWGNQYQYAYESVDGKTAKPKIWSYGPDGEDGTEDDIPAGGQQDGASGGNISDDGFEQMPEKPTTPARPTTTTE